MPIVSVIISRYMTTYAYMLLAVSLIGFIVLFGGVHRLRATVYLLLPFVIYVFCTYVTRRSSLPLWGYQNMLFLLPVIIGYYFFYYKPEFEKVFSGIIIFALIVTVITTIIGLIRFPYAARILATIATSDDLEAIKYDWNNIGGFDFVYMAVLLYPLFSLAYKLGKIHWAVFLVGSAVLLTMIILSEYTTALLLFIVSFALSLVGRKLTAQRLLILGILAFLAVFFFWGVFQQLILWLADTLHSVTLSERLSALAGGVSGVENSESQRIQFFRTSVEGFISSPLFGKLSGSYTISGGHSFILDSLADYGALGGAALLFSYRNIYHYFFKPFRKNNGYGYVLWTFVQAIILSVINTGMWLAVLTFFAPILLARIYETNSEGNYEDSLDS